MYIYIYILLRSYIVSFVHTVIDAENPPWGCAQ